MVTPNTECSWDFTTKTRSTNDDGTSLDLEWDDEEGKGLCFGAGDILTELVAVSSSVFFEVLSDVFLRAKMF